MFNNRVKNRYLVQGLDLVPRAEVLVSELHVSVCAAGFNLHTGVSVRPSVTTVTATSINNLTYNAVHPSSCRFHLDFKIIL